MEILGYIVQYFHEDEMMPETGYKHLHQSFQSALNSAKTRVEDYVTRYENVIGPFETHTPTKKDADNYGYVVVFRNAELQIWIEVVVRN